MPHILPHSFISASLGENRHPSTHSFVGGFWRGRFAMRFSVAPDRGGQTSARNAHWIHVPGSQGMYSPRWSPNGQYIPAISADSKRLLLFDFQTQKWTEVAKGGLSFPDWSKDGHYLQANDSSGTGAIIRIRLSDHKTERVVDLKNSPRGPLRVLVCGRLRRFADHAPQRRHAGRLLPRLGGAVIVSLRCGAQLEPRGVAYIHGPNYEPSRS